jgi:hypothetical protein
MAPLGPQVLQVPVELLELQALQELRGLLARLDPVERGALAVPVELLELQVPVELQERQAHKDLKAHKDRKAQ